jgi:hypothetical protein
MASATSELLKGFCKRRIRRFALRQRQNHVLQINGLGPLFISAP